MESIELNGKKYVLESEANHTTEKLEGTAYELGKKYLVRAITFHYIGRLTAISDTELVLSDACWLASSGRFHECLKTGTVSEAEPFIKPVIVHRAHIVDATEWEHELIREVVE